MSLQQPFEESPVGQAVLGVFFVALIVAVFAWNMPASKIHDEVGEKWAAPFLTSTGLQQGWDVFAPPRRATVALSANVLLADGRTVRWRPPNHGRFFMPYRGYRWIKWMEKIRTDASEPFWYQTAAWIARRYADESPVKVTLVRTWKYSTPPGTNQVDQWHVDHFYTLQVGSAG